jgi:hypothetical protein
LGYVAVAAAAVALADQRHPSLWNQRLEMESDTNVVAKDNGAYLTGQTGLHQMLRQAAAVAAADFDYSGCPK